MYHLHPCLLTQDPQSAFLHLCCPLVIRSPETAGTATCGQGFRFFPPTFPRGQEAVHVDAAARVWDRQGAAGYESLLRGRALSGSHQAPARSIARALQHLHRLSGVDTQLTRRTRDKVLQHHRVFTATRELKDRGGRERKTQRLQNHSETHNL